MKGRNFWKVSTNQFEVVVKGVRYLVNTNVDGKIQSVQQKKTTSKKKGEKVEKAQGKLTSDNHASCSGLPALFGVSGYETRNEYLDSRIRARLGENVRSEKGIHAEMGNILENPILEITTEKLGLANLEKI